MKNSFFCVNSGTAWAGLGRKKEKQGTTPDRIRHFAGGDRHTTRQARMSEGLMHAVGVRTIEREKFLGRVIKPNTRISLKIPDGN